MPRQIVDEQVEGYMRALLDRHDTDVLVEMETLAKEKGFPIVNRHAGTTLELLARSIGARTVFELGSGYGYSAWWFARAVGPQGTVHCTDGDEANRDLAETFLSRAGVWANIEFHVGDAVTALNATDGEFDVVYCDIDKHGYPDAWRAARERVRVGGLYICDNVLWSGRVVEDPVESDVRPGWTEAIREQNELISSDADFLSSILPIRDGLIVALRLR